MKASELRPGMGVMMDGKLGICVQSVHVTPGNLRAFVQAKVRVIQDGTMLEKRLRSTEDIEQAFLDRRQMQYLYADSIGLVLMDNETYDQVTVPKEMVAEMIPYLKPDTSVTTLVYEGTVVSLELPKVVELAVIETSPQPKGATATNQLKEAVLETGLKTRVPPFIENGEVLKISTEDGSYLSRAK
ncbi:MAG: elongation factor P [Phycisphaerae bacterium]|nr:elongation factor P [Phycisphaerae bacterium]